MSDAQVTELRVMLESHVAAHNRSMSEISEQLKALINLSVQQTALHERQVAANEKHDSLAGTVHELEQDLRLLQSRQSASNERNNGQDRLSDTRNKWIERIVIALVSGGSGAGIGDMLGGMLGSGVPIGQ